MAVETPRDAVETTWQVPMSVARAERTLSINEGPRSQLQIVSPKVPSQIICDLQTYQLQSFNSPTFTEKWPTHYEHHTSPRGRKPSNPQRPRRLWVLTFQFPTRGKRYLARSLLRSNSFERRLKTFGNRFGNRESSLPLVSMALELTARIVNNFYQ